MARRGWDDRWQNYPASKPLPADGIATSKQRGGGLGSVGSGVLDVLGLVQRQPTPTHGGEMVGVSGDQRIGGEHHVGGRRPLDKLGLVVVPVAAVVHQHRQPGGEPCDLPLPVAQHRHRCDHQGGPGRRVGQHGGDELRCLAQAHVVGQACTQPQPSEEGQPAHAPLLVRAEDALEPGRVNHRGDRSRQRVVEQLTQPPGGGHALDLELVGCVQVAESQVGSQQLGHLGGHRLHRARAGVVAEPDGLERDGLWQVVTKDGREDGQQQKHHEQRVAQKPLTMEHQRLDLLVPLQHLEFGDPLVAGARRKALTIAFGRLAALRAAGGQGALLEA